MKDGLQQVVFVASSLNSPSQGTCQFSQLWNRGGTDEICATIPAMVAIPKPQRAATGPMPNDASPPTQMNRRQFLRKAGTSAVVGIAAESGIELASSRRLHAQMNLTPDAALHELLAGNQRFAANQLTSIEHDLDILKAHTIDKQEPFAGVLACADSRVPVELVFDQSIGHIFVTRVAGNFVTAEIIASLEYGVAVLGIRALLVLGHAGCGAVKAAMKADGVPGQISSLYPHLRPAVEQSAGNVDKAIEINARVQSELLRTSSTVIRDAVKAGTLKVTAGVYDLANGKVTLS
jgi:carbonic anhydrase